jgi:uncharacterized membrane protein YkvA (DUF1232 family)
VRLALVGLLAWQVNPIDLIPEFVPVLGPLDDVIVAIIVLRYVRRRLDHEELRRRWAWQYGGLRPAQRHPQMICAVGQGSESSVPSNAKLNQVVDGRAARPLPSTRWLIKLHR